MGNEHSQSGKKDHKSTPRSKNVEEKVDPRAETAFKVLSSGTNGVTEDHVKNLFATDLAESLWKYFSAETATPSSSGLSIQQLAPKLIPLFGSSTDIYVKICQPIHHFIKVCLEAAGGEAYESDVSFINALIQNMTSQGDSWNAIVEWKNAVCPRFCHPVQSLVSHKLLGYDKPHIDLSSDIVSPIQMFYIQSSLPMSYFPKDKATGELVGWSPLYTSAMQGISVNRLETNLKDGRIAVVASDTTIRNSTTRYGGQDTVYYEISPSLKRIEAQNSIYSNFKIRSASMGFSFKEILKIDKELDEVSGIEVWGCAGGNTLQEQRNLREWQNRQAERNKKVPLPGNWDDNPDKTLLEMAGHHFSNERANMEMEARRREEANK